MEISGNDLGMKAHKAFHQHLGMSGQIKTDILKAMVENLDIFKREIIIENQKDLKQGKIDGLSTAMLDRLLLDEKKIEKIKEAIENIISLSDPIGMIEYSFNTVEGLVIHQERVPIGVILIIFESRPNIVPEIAALSLKSGNACILRGGKEAIRSNVILGKVICESLKKVGVNKNLIQIIDTPDKKLVTSLLQAGDFIDLVIPRGGKGLIEFVSKNSVIPVVKHDDGICHTYIHHDASEESSINIALNAKIARPGVCNAMETLLIHRDFSHQEKLINAFREKKVELRVDETLKSKYPFAKLATEEDWRSEYLDLILSVKQVKDLDEAINWINEYGSHHSDAIVTNSIDAAQQFQNKVDSACVFVNASTRFADGGCFGLGAEVGISTQKLHCRGPMGLKDLTSLKYKILGKGQVRN